MTAGQRAARSEQRWLFAYASMLIAGSLWIGTPRAQDLAVLIAFMMMTGSAVINAMRALAKDAA
jgi:hypothetical protein